MGILFISLLSNRIHLSLLPNEKIRRQVLCDMSLLRIVTLAAVAVVSARAKDSVSVSPCGNLTISSEYQPLSSVLPQHRAQEGDPPYSGTIFVESTIITA